MREARARLDREYLLRASGWIGVLGVIALMLGSVFYFQKSAGGLRHVDGTVESADWRLNGETGHVYPFIEVRLEDGSAVRVGNAAPVLPAVGDRITLRQRGMLFDTMTVYEWDGPDMGEVKRATFTHASAP